jgi:4-diphosphocytidyl-2-C-methyl-D-erythritol kinase
VTPPGAWRAAGACVHAQAKVNLRLRILAREAGGHHQLETLFLRLALADIVRVRPAGTRSLQVTGVPEGTDLGPAERNLAWRAAAAYMEAAGRPDGFAIELEKRIPVGGGLGGGSADAGAVLRALDALSASPLGSAALLEIAATLGADVPFLASEHPYALAWGRGERMLALSPLSPREVVLVVPPFGVDTTRAYGWLAEARAARGAERPSALVLSPGALASWDALIPLARNDFEPPVTARHPEIAGLVEWLGSIGCAPAMMSGSGSVVVGVLPEGASKPPRGVRDSVPCGRVIVTRTADRVEPVRLLD